MPDAAAWTARDRRTRKATADRCIFEFASFDYIVLSPGKKVTSLVKTLKPKETMETRTHL